MRPLSQMLSVLWVRRATGHQTQESWPVDFSPHATWHLRTALWTRGLGQPTLRPRSAGSDRVTVIAHRERTSMVQRLNHWAGRYWVHISVPAPMGRCKSSLHSTKLKKKSKQQLTGCNPSMHSMTVA